MVIVNMNRRLACFKNDGPHGHFLNLAYRDKVEPQRYWARAIVVGGRPQDDR